MSKHTKEPWCLPPGDLIFVSKVGGRGHIAKMMPLDAPRDRKGLPTDISDEMCANARRIVACVNACRGLPTDELEQKGLVAAVGTQLLEADRQCDELRQERQREHALRVRLTGELEVASQQRDELLAALESMLQWVAYAPPDDLSYLERAHAAIKKVKGGAA